jgi:hypothetical protein
MPTDFGDITTYHRLEASRHYALAQTAREEGDLGKAEYLVDRAVRHAEAAHEQQMAMMLEPGPSIAEQTPNRWSPEPQRSPSAANRLRTVLRGAGHLATAIQQSFARRNSHFEGLSLR